MYIKLLIGFVLFATLVALTVLQVPHSERLIDLLYMALLGLGITHLSGQSADDAPAAPIDKQGGRALPVMLAMIVAAALGLMQLSGCASVQQAVNAYGAAAITGAKATNDTLIEANKVALCATPISALVRHPELVPAVRSLCLPAKDSGNVGQLLDAIKPAAAS